MTVYRTLGPFRAATCSIAVASILAACGAQSISADVRGADAATDRVEAAADRVDIARCAVGAVRCGAACVDAQSDPSNCGGCGIACGASVRCAGGLCQAGGPADGGATSTDAGVGNDGSGVTDCPATQLLCGSACVDVSSDTAHCSACGVRCPPGWPCGFGRCGGTGASCPAGHVECRERGGCRDVSADPEHCGGCGRACSTGQVCVMGSCTTPGARRCTQGADCDDRVACTRDVCLVEGVCRNVPRDEMCPAGQACSATSGCAATAARAIGSACMVNADCVTTGPSLPALCVAPAMGAPGGYCTSGCMHDRDCPRGAVCVATRSSSPTEWSWRCVVACGATTACRAGYVCGSFGGSSAACLSDCRLQPGLCGADRCDPGTGVCSSGCGGDGECSPGSRCVFGGCQCGSTTACLASYACNAAGSCGCTGDAACGPGRVCQASGYCQI